MLIYACYFLPLATIVGLARIKMAQECSICAELKSTEQYPASPISQECAHAPTTCLSCIARAIKTDLSSKPWEKVGCPECGVTLEYQVVQKYADRETRAKHDRLMVLHTLQQSPDFVWVSHAACIRMISGMLILYPTVFIWLRLWSVPRYWRVRAHCKVHLVWALDMFPA